MHLFFDDNEIENKLAFVFKPKKYKYSESELGYGKQNIDELVSPRMTMHASQQIVERADFSVHNLRQEKLQCSLYFNKQTQCKDVIVVYLHGNAGTRLDSVPAVKHIVQQIGVDMCSFDFSGCGKSEGDFVSLGLKEQDDLQAVLEKLINRFNYKKVILYGRSMGGVTSLMYSANRSFAQKYVLAIIVDSPFCSLKKLATEIADEKVSFFGGFIAGMSFEYIRDLVKKMTQGHDIFSLEVDKSIGKCTQYPALFCYSYEDKLIKYTHSEKLIAGYGGKASSFVFSGDHNAFRDDSYFSKIKKFLKDILVENKIHINHNQKLQVSASFSGLSTSQGTSQLKSQLNPGRTPTQNINLQDKFLIYQQQVLKNQQLPQTSPFEHSSSTNNLISAVGTSNNNMTPLIQSYQNNPMVKQSIDIGITSPQHHLNHHQNNLFHKQQSLPIHSTSQNRFDVSQQQTLKKQSSYVQIRNPSECATRISLVGKSTNEFTIHKANQGISENPLQKSISIENTTNNTDKNIGVTQISGIRKIPSQPLVFPNELNENKRVSLIDYTQSQRQAPTNSLIDAHSPHHKIFSKDTSTPSQPQQQHHVILHETEKKEERRRQSIFRKINSVQLNNSGQKQHSQQPTSNILKQINGQYGQVTPFTDNISGVNELKSNRAQEAYFINQHHRQSLAPNNLLYQNTSNSTNNLNSITSTSTGTLYQDTTKSIANLSSPFISPRIITPYQQSVNQIGSQKIQNSNEIKQVDTNVVQYGQKSPQKSYLNQLLHPSSDKLQPKSLISSNNALELNENYENQYFAKQQPSLSQQQTNIFFQQNETNRIKSTLYQQQQSIQIPHYEALLFKNESNKIKNLSFVNESKSSQKVIRIL